MSFEDALDARGTAVQQRFPSIFETENTVGGAHEHLGLTERILAFVTVNKIMNKLFVKRMMPISRMIAMMALVGW